MPPALVSVDPCAHRGSGPENRRVLKVYIDAGDGMASRGEVAIWGFDLDVWGECAQAADETAALQKYAARVGRDDLAVTERIVGPRQVFDRDFVPATDDEIDATIRILRQQRVVTVDLIQRADAAGALDADDPSVVQPAWMPWRTPRAIARHLVEDASSGYLKRLGLPTRTAIEDLTEDLKASAAHMEKVLREMPHDLVSEYKGEVWTSVKLLRRQAWHERVEQVFLRRRLRAAGVST